MHFQNTCLEIKFLYLLHLLVTYHFLLLLKISLWIFLVLRTLFHCTLSMPECASGATVIQVSSSGSHSVALKSDGTVWTWGVNNYGQLGDGTTTDSPTPVQVLGLTDVTVVAAGGVQTAALKSDGTVWAWGSNVYGQLGDGTTTQSAIPVQASGLTGVTAISSGGYHTVALEGRPHGMDMGI